MCVALSIASASCLSLTLSLARFLCVCMFVRYRSQLDHLFQLLEKGAADLQVRKRIFRAPAILYGKIEHLPRQARDKQHRERALKKRDDDQPREYQRLLELVRTIGEKSPVGE